LAQEAIALSFPALPEAPEVAELPDPAEALEPPLSPEPSDFALFVEQAAAKTTNASSAIGDWKSAFTPSSSSSQHFWLTRLHRFELPFSRRRARRIPPAAEIHRCAKAE